MGKPQVQQCSCAYLGVGNGKCDQLVRKQCCKVQGKSSGVLEIVEGNGFEVGHYPPLWVLVCKVKLDENLMEGISGSDPLLLMFKLHTVQVHMYRLDIIHCTWAKPSMHKCRKWYHNCLSLPQPESRPQRCSWCPTTLVNYSGRQPATSIGYLIEVIYVHIHCYIWT